jgi:hypothetical protein
MSKNGVYFFFTECTQLHPGECESYNFNAQILHCNLLETVKRFEDYKLAA